MESLKQIRSRIETASCKSGRQPSDITLIAVAKSQASEKIREAVQAGITDIGENYAQEMLEHQGGIKGKVHWHFIGHLQKNKVKKIIDRVDFIHSVDSLSLAGEIDRQAKRLGKKQSILLEINVGGEPSKTGLPCSGDIFDLIPRFNELDSVKLIGLMVIPPFDEDPEKVRPFFRRLREMRDEMNSRKLCKNRLTALSMGMTHDFETAIEEGATMVRIGTGLFGSRKETDGGSQGERGFSP